MNAKQTKSPYGARKKKHRNPPRGWRRLALGEVVQAGDQCYFCSRWEAVLPHEIGHVICRFSFARARKIEPGSRSSDVTCSECQQPLAQVADCTCGKGRAS